MSTASSGQQSTDSLNGKLTFEQDKNRIVGRDQDNKARLIILADGDEFSMKVAKAGFDVLTATGSQLIFNSSQNVFKIVTSSTSSVTIGAGTSGFTTIAHGLGYTPALLAYLNFSGLYEPFGMPHVTESGSNSGKVYFTSYASVDATNIYFQVTYPDYSGHSAFTHQIRYYLLQETAT